jgi:hypothetical protein
VRGDAQESAAIGPSRSDYGGHVYCSSMRLSAIARVTVANGLPESDTVELTTYTYQ